MKDRAHDGRPLRVLTMIDEASPLLVGRIARQNRIDRHAVDDRVVRRAPQDKDGAVLFERGVR